MEIRGIASVLGASASYLKSTAPVPRTAAARVPGSLTLASDVWAPSGDVPAVPPVRLLGQEAPADAPAPDDPIARAAAKACGGGT